MMRTRFSTTSAGTPQTGGDAGARVSAQPNAVVTTDGPNGPVRIITMPDGRGGTQQIVVGGEGAVLGGSELGVPARVQDDIPPGVMEMTKITGAIAVIIIIGLPIARAVSRWIDRRSSAPPSVPEVARRLEAIEQAVDAVAVEVERISEGQRFATKLLSERAQQPVPAFVASVGEPVQRARG